MLSSGGTSVGRDGRDGLGNEGFDWDFDELFLPDIGTIRHLRAELPT